jgi:hypothetical protein
MTTHLLEHFRQYVRDSLVPGVNGDDEKVDYIAPAILKTYWTERRVDAILNEHEPPISQSSDMIISRYLQIFSILVHIGEPGEISWFFQNVKHISDVHLPLDKDSFPVPCSWAEAFLETQWMFNPLLFTSDYVYQRIISCKTILPVTYEKPLTEKRGGQSKVWKVQLHSKCNLVTSEVFLS